jgi:Fe-S cluster assembly ATP-binding protein
MKESKMAFLEVKDLHVSIDGKKILDGLTLNIDKGEVHAIMGPNGSGKSTLANAVMGHPKYSVDSGEIKVKGQVINDMGTDARARLGLFLGFQYPTEISGVGYSHFLRNAYNQLNKSLGEEQNREVFLTVR